MNFLILIFFTSFGIIAGLETSQVDKRCYKFTWPGALKPDENKDAINCTALEKMKIPCVNPTIYKLTHPNLTEIWENRDNRNYEYPNSTCFLQKGISCIKYTYSFDNAITNATYFCGKTIKNKETATTNGCFTQKIGGYDVEACVCQPNSFRNDPNEMPCNLSTKLNYSLAVLVLTLLVLLHTNFKN